MNVFYMVVHTLTRARLTYASKRNQTSGCLSTTRAPRLFARRGDATQACTRWCRGVQWATDTSTPRATAMSIVCQPKPDRDIEEMAIVPVLLLELDSVQWARAEGLRLELTEGAV